MQIYVQHNGQQLGPFTETELKALLAAGTVVPSDYIWWQGQANWIPLSQSQFALPGTSGMPLAPGTHVTLQVAPTSQLAIWSLVLSCLSLLCGILSSIPAIILGHLSLSEIKKNPSMQGRGMALAGLIIGYIMTALMLIWIVCVIVLMSLGSQVKTTFTTIDTQTSSSSSSSDSDQSTNSSDSSDSSTNSTPNITP